MDYRLCSFIFFFFVTKVLLGQADFENWLQKDTKGFDEYISKEDKLFLDFLSKEWKKYDLDKGFTNDKNPKPVTLPFTQESNPEFFSNFEQKFPQNQHSVSKLIPPKDVTINTKENRTGIKIIRTNFYERILEWEIENEFKIITQRINTTEDFSKFWKEISSLKYDIIISQLSEYKSILMLNDWGYLLLVNNISDNIAPNTKDIKNLLNWFFLVKSGYKVKAGLVGKKVHLLIPSTNRIYKTPFLYTENDSINLYVINPGNPLGKIDGEIITYEQDFPGAEKLFDLNIKTSPLLGDEISNSILKFTYDNQEYDISVLNKKSLIDFYEFYPNSDLDIYFNSSVDYTIANSLLNSLQEIIKNKPEVIAANILLRFVQTAFKYKTDSETFDREKPLFKEETLFYSGSDCEDRAVLFAYLIKELLGLEVIGIDYPGHVAVAVKFNADIPGDFIHYKKNKYMICDPTYIGAYVGLAMPQFKNAVIENIVELSDKINAN